MNLWMDPLSDRLTTCPFKMDREFTIELYPN